MHSISFGSPCHYWIARGPCQEHCRTLKAHYSLQKYPHFRSVCRGLIFDFVTVIYLFAVKYNVMPSASGIIHRIINWLQKNNGIFYLNIFSTFTVMQNFLLQKNALTMTFRQDILYWLMSEKLSTDHVML